MKKFALFFILIFYLLTCSLQAVEFKRILGPLFSAYSRPWPGPFSGNYPLVLDGSSTLSPFRNNRFSFFGGLGLEFSLSPLLGLELEVLYKEAGEQYRIDTLLFDSYRFELQLRELSFPLLLKVRFWKKSRPYFLAGTEFSFILSHRYQIFYRPEASQILEKVEEGDIKGYTSKSDLALVLGPGFEAAVNRRKVQVELRYELGLPDLNSGPVLTPEGKPIRVRSRQLLLVITYGIE